MHRQIPAVVLILVTSNWALAQYCAHYNSSNGSGVIEVGPNTKNHNKANTYHSLLSGAVNDCSYTDAGGIGTVCITQETLQPEGTAYDSNNGSTFEPFGHKTDTNYVPASVRDQGKTTATGRAEFAVQGCYLPGCPGGVTFSFPPFSVTGSHVIYSNYGNVSDFCLQHTNVAPKGCFGQCGTPLMADLSEVFGKKTDGNDIDHLTDKEHGATFKFKRHQGQDWSDVKPETVGWTERGSYMAVLIRPNANGEYAVETSDNVFGNYSTCASGKLCANGVEALRYYCDDPINSGNGDGVCDSKDLNWKKLRWEVGRTRALTMQQSGVEVFRLDAEEMKGKSLRTDQFGNVFKVRSSMHLKSGDKGDVHRDFSIWDVVPDQQGMKVQVTGLLQ